VREGSRRSNPRGTSARLVGLREPAVARAIVADTLRFASRQRHRVRERRAADLTVRHPMNPRDERRAY
jgi:hypothetical protein